MERKHLSHEERKKIIVRRVADNEVKVTFPEDLGEDLKLVTEKDGLIPPEFLNAALARSIVSRTQLAAGCTNKCGKDCFW